MILVLILAATLYRVEPTNGTVSFTITKWGVIREEGTFRNFTANVVFDRQQAAKSRVDFEVDTRSVDTKNESRDGTLRGIDFLDVQRHPKMTFRSVSVVPRGNGVANVTGDLTIRGVTRRITVPVRLVGVGRQGPDGPEVAGFETSFVIDRRAFGVTGGRWTAHAPGVLGNDVTIHIRAGGVSR